VTVPTKRQDLVRFVLPVAATGAAVVAVGALEQGVSTSLDGRHHAVAIYVALYGVGSVFLLAALALWLYSHRASTSPAPRPLVRKVGDVQKLDLAAVKLPPVGRKALIASAVTQMRDRERARLALARVLTSLCETGRGLRANLNLATVFVPQEALRQAVSGSSAAQVQREQEVRKWDGQVVAVLDHHGDPALSSRWASVAELPPDHPTLGQIEPTTTLADLKEFVDAKLGCLLAIIKELGDPPPPSDLSKAVAESKDKEEPAPAPAARRLFMNRLGQLREEGRELLARVRPPTTLANQIQNVAMGLVPSVQAGWENDARAWTRRVRAELEREQQGFLVIFDIGGEPPAANVVWPNRPSTDRPTLAAYLDVKLRNLARIMRTLHND
jgi:hypothetical protein